MVDAIDLEIEDVVERGRHDVTGAQGEQARDVRPPKVLQLLMERGREQKEREQQGGDAIPQHRHDQPELPHFAETALSGHSEISVSTKTSHTMW